MKYCLYILTLIISITLPSCSSYSKQEEKDFNKLIVGSWKSIGEQQTTEHIINSDGSINTHWSFGSVGGLKPSDQYRKWEIFSGYFFGVPKWKGVVCTAVRCFSRNDDVE